MPLVEDQYDGEVRTKAMNEIVMREVIVQIMRRLFDYEALSSQCGPELDLINDLVNLNANSVGEPLHEAISINGGDIVWDDLPGFDDQSQENEWLLFGMPWTAYWSEDSILPVHFTWVTRRSRTKLCKLESAKPMP